MRGSSEGSSGEQEQGEKSGTHLWQDRLCLGDNLRNRGVVKWSTTRYRVGKTTRDNIKSGSKEG